METGLKKFDVYVVTSTSKVFLGCALKTNAHQAKQQVLNFLNTKIVLEELKTNSTEYSIVVEVDATHTLFK